MQETALLALLFAVLLQFSNQTEYLNSKEDVCRYFSDGAKIRKPGTCSEWIVCQDHKTTPGGVCEGTKPYFILSTGACAKSLDSWDSYCSAPCTTKTEGYYGSTLNCENWYYCNGKTLLASGPCGNGQYFNDATKSCVYPQNTDCNAQFELCQVAPKDTFFVNENSCNSYYNCVKGKLTTVNCDNSYYDVDTGLCVPKATVKCEVHPIPADACGTTKLAKRDKFVSDGATCSGYLYCHDLGSGKPDPSPVWQQCPLGYFFDEDFQRCTERQYVKCSEDRCEGITSGRTVAENPGCHYYLECTDGVSSAPIQCPDNLYFDEDKQECVTVEKKYTACTV
ncbi:peritrophin-48 [Scaptodrosophila lebanonensis]|uniref:Peritrophin-48 n=1 Tax=Drosophila lebanonensis TaxID=7225 RepID=A0A6J2T9P1_DROLE|nr:peritrophin-48 [Scaptodrosophila lebanonensis]